MKCPQFLFAQAQLAFKFESKPNDDILYLTEIVVNGEVLKDAQAQEAFALNPFSTYGSFQSVIYSDKMIHIEAANKTRHFVDLSRFFEVMDRTEYECFQTLAVVRQFTVTCDIKTSMMGEFTKQQITNYIHKNPPIEFKFEIYDKDEVHLVEAVQNRKLYKDIQLYRFLSAFTKPR